MAFSLRKAIRDTLRPALPEWLGTPEHMLKYAEVEKHDTFKDSMLETPVVRCVKKHTKARGLKQLWAAAQQAKGAYSIDQQQASARLHDDHV